ncbi:MAG: AzlD domain-containing protein [Pontimonas sp.]|nr:AzlD domain-containing protein [Pontimonas sp.]
MTIWIALIAAGVVVWVLKNLGYLVPPRFVEGALMSRVAGLVTVALLASLVMSQTLQSEMGVSLDARVPAVGVAAILLYFRAPFLIVLLAAGAVAAGLRFFGVMV